MTRFLGYDPGGDGTHGVAWLEVGDSGQANHDTACLRTAGDAVAWFLENGGGSPAAIGVDTLTEWNLGSAGWRPADLWLQKRYPDAKKSVASPNSIFGSMSLSGMAVLHRLREKWPDLVVSETHPKVLYFALTKRRYAWSAGMKEMNAWCATMLGTPVACGEEHEWDALLSAWAAAQGLRGKWTNDLHALPDVDHRAVRPLGATRYYWP